MFSKSVVTLAALSFACGLPAQSQKKLTARELFYTPIPAAAPAPAATPATPAPAKSQKAKDPVAKVKATPNPETTAARAPRPVTVPLTNAAYNPLALRYSLLKVTGNSDAEVDPTSVFRSGDRIRLSVRANSPGYLYIVNQGSSKRWNVMFPSPDIDHGNNRIEANHDYLIPSTDRFYFDENPGAERLVIVLTRQPEADLEKLIYSLDSGSAGKAEKSMMLAQNHAPAPVQDSIIEKLRGKMLSRDLVFEKVDDKTPGETKEKAMYVATQNQSADARLVVDLALKHQ
jgi:hypothetical protein